MTRINKLIGCALLAAALAACGSDSSKSAEPSAPAAAPDAKKVDRETAGDITGKVVLEGTPPQNAVLKMASDPACGTGEVRAENFVVGRPDLKDTIARLQAYQEAGADVLYAPGLASKDDVAAVVGAVDRPVNVLVVPAAGDWSVADLSRLGVKRISTGSVLARAALGGFLRAAREMREHGTFGFGKDAASSREIAAMLEP